MNGYDPEHQKILDLFEHIRSKNQDSCSVLDMGCGFGRNLRVLSSRGFEVLGVDYSPQIVRQNQAEGLPCLSLEDFSKEQKRRTFDIVLMSHVIEHLLPQDLLAFFDSHLEYLKVGGHLIIATPLLRMHFYDDFDHIRPYPPRSLEMIFGADGAQLKQRSRHRLCLIDLWFRKTPFCFRHLRCLHFKSLKSKLAHGINFLSQTVFVLSRGQVGSVDGWIGLYKKMS